MSDRLRRRHAFDELSLWATVAIFAAVYTAGMIAAPLLLSVAGLGTGGGVVNNLLLFLAAVAAGGAFVRRNRRLPDFMERVITVALSLAASKLLDATVLQRLAAGMSFDIHTFGLIAASTMHGLILWLVFGYLAPKLFGDYFGR